MRGQSILIFLYLLMALTAGATIPVQAGINAKLNFFAESPVTASIISFITGTGTLIVFALITRVPLPGPAAFAGSPWWIWTGGILGAFFVTSCVILAEKVGAVSMLALILAGQMAASVILDHYGILGYNVNPVSAAKIAGILLICAGVMLIRIG
jgi:transporter family-2 protein